MTGQRVRIKCPGAGFHGKTGHIIKESIHQRSQGRNKPTVPEPWVEVELDEADTSLRFPWKPRILLMRNEVELIAK